jgi:hypothetical protein
MQSAGIVNGLAERGMTVFDGDCDVVLARRFVLAHRRSARTNKMATFIILSSLRPPETSVEAESVVLRSRGSALACFLEQQIPRSALECLLAITAWLRSEG